MAGLVFAATLRDRIAQVLRDRILGGVLPDESRLDLDELADEFGSSRTPVREALILLSHDGLVEIMPRRGARVKGVSLDMIRDNFEVYGAISGIAAEWATKSGDKGLAARLRRHQHALEAGSSADDLVSDNWAFHREINRACGSPRLTAVLGQLSRTMPASYFTMIPEQAATSIAEHHAIVEAIEQGDAERARAAAELHIRRAGELIVARMTRPGSVPATTSGERVS